MVQRPGIGSHHAGQCDDSCHYSYNAVQHGKVEGKLSTATRLCGVLLRCSLEGWTTFVSLLHLLQLRCMLRQFQTGPV